MAFDPDKYLAENAPREFDPDAYLSQYEKPQEIPSTGRVARQAVIEGAASIPDVVLNTPVSAWNLGKALVGTAADVAGRPDLAPDLTSNIHPVANLLEQARISNPEDQPVTHGQRRLAAGIKGAVAAGITRQPLSGMAIGAGSNIAGEEVTQRTGSQLAGIATSLITGGGGQTMLNKTQKLAAARQQMNQAQLDAQKSINSLRDKTAADMVNQGMLLPPHLLAKSSQTQKVLSSVGGKQALEDQASVHNFAQAQNNLSAELGLPENAPITPDAIKDVINKATQFGYDPVKSLGEIKPTPEYYQALKDIARPEAEAAKSFPKGAKTDIREMVDSLVPDDPNGTFNASHMVDKIRELRQDKDFYYRQGNTRLGDAYGRASKSLEDLIDQNLMESNPSLLKNYRDSRQLIAKAKTIEDHLQPDGMVDLQKLAATVKRNPGRYSGDIKQVADFVNTYPKAFKPLKQASGYGVSKLDAAMAGVGAGVGALAKGVPGVAAAAIPLAVPPLVRKGILSDAAQKSMFPDYQSKSFMAGISPLPAKTSPLYSIPELEESQK